MRQLTSNIFRNIVTTSVAVALMIAGCSGETKGPELGAVEGTVTMDGKALPNATVEFQPVGDKGAPSNGETDEKGHYVLRYTLNKEGATIGVNIVSIRTARLKEDDEGNETRIRETVPARYNVHAVDNPDMKVDVTADGITKDFALTSKGKIIEDDGESGGVKDEGDCTDESP